MCDKMDKMLYAARKVHQVLCALMAVIALLWAGAAYAKGQARGKAQGSANKTGAVQAGQNRPNAQGSIHTAGETVAVWSGWTTFDKADWSRNVIVPPSSFASLAAGDTIEVDAADIKADYHKVKLYAAANSWAELREGTYSPAYDTQNGSVAPENGKAAYTVTASDAAALKEKGLAINGYGVVVTKVAIIRGGTADSERSGGTSAVSKAGGKGESASTASKGAFGKSIASTPVGKGGANTSAVGASASTSAGSKGGTSTLSGAKGASTVSAAAPAPPARSGTPYAAHGALHVSGAYLYDAHGKKVQLYGMSTHGLTFGEEFSRYINQTAMNTLASEWNTNCIRLALYPKDYNGYCTGGNQEQLRALVCNGIEYAAKAGMYVLVDWHVHNYNPNETRDAAKEFLLFISAKYKDYGNVLYEICNEPTSSPWSSAIKPYAQEVIPIIRANAPNAVIVVGTNTWSQDVEEAARDSLAYDNVMYTFHFYADTHREEFRSRVERAINGGLPIFITEYGTCDASGNGGFNERETQKWFALIDKYNISHINWSLSAKAESASALQPNCNKTSGWKQGDLTPSGKLVLQHYKGLKQ